MGEVMVRQMVKGDIEPLARDLQNQEVTRDVEYFHLCHDEMKSGKRVVFVALKNNKYVGTGHFLLESKYPQFREQNIPEINDLVVVPGLRKHGIGEKLMMAMEEFARFNKYDRIGLGVGLYKDYGIAQRLYVKRGYIPDGHGVVYDYKEVKPGTMVRLDDDLNLCFIKMLGSK